MNDFFDLLKNLTSDKDDDSESSEPSMSAESTERLSGLLSLEPHSELWAVWNSDSERLEEFLFFYESYTAQGPMELEELANLILESAEDVFDEEGSENQAGIQERMVLVALFIQAHHLEFPEVIKYRLEDDVSDDEVTRLMEHALLEYYGQRPLDQKSIDQESQ